mmetsp:Transcript_5045/g.11116  ORF Transcript_5045/g.11116 Transcript_5045/m.11116 type:complete len:237 (-) Transcript_5045:822-1532(-)
MPQEVALHLDHGPGERHEDEGGDDVWDGLLQQLEEHVGERGVAAIGRLAVEERSLLHNRWHIARSSEGRQGHRHEEGACNVATCSCVLKVLCLGTHAAVERHHDEAKDNRWRQAGRHEIWELVVCPCSVSEEHTDGCEGVVPLEVRFLVPLGGVARLPHIGKKFGTILTALLAASCRLPSAREVDTILLLTLLSGLLDDEIGQVLQRIVDDVESGEVVRCSTLAMQLPKVADLALD